MQNTYNRYALAILLSIVINTVFAQTSPQPNYTLVDNQSGTEKSYVARDYVSLKPGFTYSATSGKTFSAKIDAGLLFPPTDKTYKKADGSFTNDPTQGAVVGSIPGQFAVSPTGAATYTIPIEVPAGINGMQPQVSINYSSQNDFGVLGIGWDINGISSINRSAQNFHYDGVNGYVESNSINFNSTDRITLDGQRLILLNSDSFEEFENGSIYANEIENYEYVKTKISSFTNQIYFEITTKDGRVLEYGNSTNSILKNANNDSDNRILSWRLNKITDVFGNYISYYYSGSYLTQIIYTGTTTLEPTKVIDLIYENSPMKKDVYINTFLVKHDKRLKEIRIKSDNYELRRYLFTYNNLKLKEIGLISQSSESVNSTTIIWNDQINSRDDHGKTIDVINYAQMEDLGLSEADNASIYFADINGDGYQDRIQLWEGSKNSDGHLRVYLYDLQNGTYPLNYTYEKTFGYNNIGIKYRLLTTDINNDGNSDIIFFHNSDLATIMFKNDEFQVTLLPFDGNKLISLSSYPTKYTSQGFISIVTNLNNDIYPDIFILPLGKYDTSNSSPFKKVSNIFYGSEDGLVAGPSSDLLVDDMREGNAKIEIGDFNADNIGDIMVFGARYNFDNAYVRDYNGVTVFHEPSWSNLVKDARQHLTCDFNNDGLTDMAFQDEDNFNWKIAYNTGGYASFQVVDLALHNSSDETDIGLERDFSQIIDYNGDGYMDIVIADETFVKDDDWSWFNNRDYNFSETTFYFYKNINGNGFELDYSETNNSRIPKTLPTVADINNDGVQDLVLINSTNVYAYTFPNASKDLLVKSITNGLKQTQEFDYYYYTNYNQGVENLPLRNLKAPVLLATSLKDIDGSLTNYSFEDAKIHVRGKGFLGFKTVTSSNEIKNTKTVSNFDYETTFYGMNLISQQISTLDNKVISTLNQTNEVKIIDIQKKRYIPIVSKVESTDKLREITTITENLKYDSKWNATEVKTTTGSNSTTVTTNFISRVENETAYLPETITTEMSNGSDISHTRTTKYTYNTNGNIIKEIQDPNKPNELTTEYTEFDSWGHPTKVKVSANGQSRESKTEYTSNGYFIYKKTNVLDESVYYNWDNKTQELKEEIDRFGRVAVKYTYNKWGQTEETRFRDGNRTAEVLRWAEQNNPFGAMYYKYSDASGNAPVYTYYNSLGQKVATKTFGLNSAPVYEFVEYYPNGRVWRISEPSFSITDKIWATTNTYDEYGRIKTITTKQGITTYTYDKKSVKVETKVGNLVTNKTETIINDAAQTIHTIINDKKVSYTYYSSGLVKTSTPQDGSPVIMEYDLQGNRTKIIDPDAGIIESQYDGYGKLIWDKQKIHDSGKFVVTNYNYNTLNGKLDGVIRNAGTTNAEITTYTYDDDLYFKSRIKSIEISGKHKQTFKYDDFSRVTERIEEIKGKKFSSITEYDALGRVKKEVYPSGYYITNKYDNYSNLIEINDSKGKLIWRAVTENARGQLTEVFRGGKSTFYGFDSRGLPKTITTTDNVVNLEYNFNDKLNLEYRIDHQTHQKEMFYYDEFNRLKNWNIYKNEILMKSNDIGYDDNGNIVRKSDLGDFTLKYGEPINSPDTPPSINRNPGIHALTSIDGTPVIFSTANLNVTYTDFKKIRTLNEGDKEYIITYGVDDQRRMSEYKVNNDLKLTRYYLGGYEEEVYKNGNVRKIHYLSGAIYIDNSNANDSLYFVYTDYQGSVIALTDEAGNVERSYAYDPWGARRNNEDWTQKDNCVDLIINRGYTGHEHLDAFGIINMNGRVYDPLTAMFFSPDPYISSPEDWLSYNRYSYVLNNPFRYTDPSGNVPWFIVPTFSYSYYGGLSVGLTGGIGIPGGASIGGSVSYNFKHGNFSATANYSIAGAYAYAGFDTKAGFIAGAGWGFGSFSAGNFAASCNMLGVSMNYSSNNGFSFSMFGFNMTSSGMQFDPSISASYTFNSENLIKRQTQTQTTTNIQDPMQILARAVQEMNLISEANWPAPPELAEQSEYRGPVLSAIECVATAKVMKAEVVVTEGYLSKYMKLSDVIYSPTAQKYKIDNTPTAEHIENLKILGVEVYDKIYERFDGNVKINSSYRTPALNKKVGGADNSQHMVGQAIDIAGINGVSNSQIYHYVKENLTFHQLIWEKGNNINPQWVHVGYRTNGNNSQSILRIR